MQEKIVDMREINISYPRNRKTNIVSLALPM